MIEIRSEKERFNFRTAAIIYNLDKSKVLIHKAIWQDSWIMPGGRMEVGEDTLTGIKRELIEELGINEEVRLKYTTECFFKFNNLDYHQVSFFYEVRIDPNKYNLNNTEEFLGLEGDDQLFKWIDIKDIDNYVFRPKYLKEMIVSDNEDVKHLIIDERL